MAEFATFLSVTCFIFLSFPSLVIPDEILSCGGFIRAGSSSIDLTKVKVQLITNSGAIKHVAEPLPNGYYMIPIYERLKYQLRLAPLPGWSFEPEGPVEFDYKVCEENRDFNFDLVGFLVQGRLISAGSSVGPSGVEIDLLDSASNSVQTTVTLDDGRYKFNKVMPGKYSVKASGDYLFSKESLAVELKDDMVTLETPLEIRGYPISGFVYNQGQPVAGIQVLLQAQTEIAGCPKDGCSTTTDETGSYRFSGVTPQDYTLKASFSSKDTVFYITPSHIDITVQHQPFVCKEPFQISGFSASGVVLSHKKGSGVKEAKIFLDGVETTVTKSDGSYTIERLKEGSYKLSVTVVDMEFEDLQVQVTANNPRLPDLIPSKLRVSGTISHADVEKLAQTIVHFTSTALSTKTQAKKNGEFSAFLTPGEYTVKTSLPDLSPSSRSLSVSDRPIPASVLTFSQFRSDLVGSVSCKQSCAGVRVELQSEGKLLQSHEVEGTSAKGEFTFKDVAAGDYQVTVSRADWCWESEKAEVTVSLGEITTPKFIQTGFLIYVESTNTVSIDYSSTETNKTGRGTAEVPKGSSQICVPNPGQYKITPKSCHRFSEASYEILVGGTVSMKLTEVSLKIRLESPISVSDVSLLVTGKDIDKTLSIKAVKKGGTGKYDGEEMIHLPVDLSSVLITPTSRTVLFPEELPLKADLSSDCPGATITVSAEEGLFVEGGTTPATPDLVITIASADSSLNYETSTDSQGKYRLGPLPKVEYSAESSKPGYVITKDEKNSFQFTVYRLAQVVVKVQCAGELLSGVLLSLSGGTFRSNNITDANGGFTFIGLAPGDYYLKAIMKEYEFSPSAQMVKVREGENTEVTISGIRVAYSFLGAIVDIAGRPIEVPVSVRARGTEGDCLDMEESVLPDSTGNFRLRGMKPLCHYRIDMINEQTSQNQFSFSISPEFVLTQMKEGDTRIDNFVAVRMDSMTQTVVFVDSSNEFLSTLSIKVMRENGGKVIYSKPVTTKVVYLPNIPTSSEKYRVVLESNLDRSSYKYKQVESSFTADSAFKQIDLRFFPKVKPATISETSESSLAAFTLFSILAAAIYMKDKIKLVIDGLRQ